MLESCRRGCSKCKALLNIVNTVAEEPAGLASILQVKCGSCQTMNKVQTSKTVPSKNGKRRVFSVNTKAALGMLFTMLEQLCLYAYVIFSISVRASVHTCVLFLYSFFSFFWAWGRVACACLFFGDGHKVCMISLAQLLQLPL